MHKNLSSHYTNFVKKSPLISNKDFKNTNDVYEHPKLLSHRHFFLLKYFNIVINIIINILNNVGSNTLKISLLHSEMYKYFFEIVTKIFFISN